MKKKELNKELISIIDDNNVMYVGEHHFSDDFVPHDAAHYLLKNLVTVGYSYKEESEKKLSVSLIPVGIPDILSSEDNHFFKFKTSKIKLESYSDFTPEFLEKYNAVFTPNE
jgi:hypothetical protein